MQGLSSFAKPISNSDSLCSVAAPQKLCSVIRRIHSRQATLCRACARRQVYPQMLCGLRGEWVGCHMPLCSSHKPLLPAPTRFWAKQADTRNFIDMPYDGLLPPSSHLQHLTRILRHSILQLLYYHITKKMSNEIFQPSLYLTKLTISLKKLVSPSIPSSKPRHLERSMSANTRHCSTP